MLSERMADLGFEFLDDGTLRLEQSAGYGESVLVDVHPCQLRLLAERAGIIKPQPINLAEHLAAGHMRRLRALCERIAELHSNDAFFNDLWDRCGDAAEWWMHIRAIAEQADELLADIGDNAAGASASETASAGRVASAQTVLDLDEAP